MKGSECMARGVKIDNQKVAEIVTSYALTNSYNATAKECGVSANSVKNIITKQKLENAQEFEKVCKDKKEEFSTRANRIIDKALTLLERRFDTALNNQDELEELIDTVFECNEDGKDKVTRKEKVDIAKKLSRLELNSLSEITTSMGTLIDKSRLLAGESTENNKFEVNIKVVE